MNNDGQSTAGTAANSSIEHWLCLRHLDGIGSIRAQAILERLGSVGALFTASRRDLTGLGLNDSQISAILSRDLPDISADLRWLQASPQHHVISLEDSRYPPALLDLQQPPLLLYLRGDPDYLLQPQLAMVGSRHPTAAGRHTAREFARHLSQKGLTITSGLAAGIDGASHEGAIEGLGGSIAVLAHGLDIVYPAQHQKLAQQISQHGALISEMPIGTRPARGLFPRRNRLISALSLGTLVVEAARKSGSLITARYAMEQNRDVFAIPGSIHNPLARGCHQLLREGARLVESADDILEELGQKLGEYLADSRKTGGENSKNPVKMSKEPDSPLDPDHQKLLKCLAYEPASIDELVLRSQFSAAEVASMLLILELEGIIVCQDGRYTRVSAGPEKA